MMKQGIRRKGAVTGVAATAAFGLVIVGSVPAIAADYQLGPDDVAPYEFGDESSADWNYNEWHISQSYNPDAQLEEYVTFNECSVSFEEEPRGPQHHVVLLKGFDLDERPVAGLGEWGGDGTLAEFQAFVESVEIEVISGSVTLQLPVFEFDGDDDPDVINEFTTIRSVSLGEGVHRFADLEITDSASWHDHSQGPNWTSAYAQYQYEVDRNYFYEILGVGFSGSEGAEVASLTFGGDTYYFGTGDCTPIDDVEEEDDVEDEVEDDVDAGEEIIAPTPPASVETDA